METMGKESFTMTYSRVKTVLELSQGNIKIVKFNKPHKKNALDTEMYVRVTKILNEAAGDKTVSILVLTGTGDFYSSGNDLSAAVSSNKTNNILLTVLTDFINAFITFPKLLIAIVNGPAIGIAATTLALCDMVYASEKSYFYTPFTKLGLVPEGCSTFTFPRLLGMRKATEMLMFNHRLSAQEALRYGFVNELFKPEELHSKVWTKIKELSELPQLTVTESKKLLRRNVQSQMMDANKTEMEALNLVWNSEDYLNSVLKFTNKSKI